MSFFFGWVKSIKWESRRFHVKRIDFLKLMISIFRHLLFSLHLPLFCARTDKEFNDALSLLTQYLHWPDWNEWKLHSSDILLSGWSLWSRYIHMCSHVWSEHVLSYVDLLTSISLWNFYKHQSGPVFNWFIWSWHGLIIAPWIRVVVCEFRGLSWRPILWWLAITYASSRTSFGP